MQTEYILNGMFGITLVIGVLTLIGGIVFSIYNKTDIASIFYAVAQICLISVLFTVISKSSYFLDYFSDILEEIVYSTGHIGHRKDKEEIWNRVTQCLFISKVPDLHQEISSTIRNTYIPNDSISYYNNYRQLLNIKWVDKEKKILKSEDKFSFDLHTVNTDRFCFERENWVPNSTKVLNNGRRTIISYKVNGEDMTDKVSGRKKTDDEDKLIEGNDCYVNEIWLAGYTIYHIEQKTEREFCLNDDCYSGFMARWLVNNMDVRVTHPKDLNVKYITRGTANHFNIVKDTDENLDIEYKGLILRNQGYILLFTEHTN